MKTPIVSVVMPVYNGERYVVDAVASIIEQTYSDWQLICVNDGSTDASGELLDWFARCDPRITVLHQPNSGIVAALNKGIAASKSPLICRMDCDDIALPNRLELQASFMRDRPDCVVVGGAILEVDADNSPLQVSRLPQEHGPILDNLLNRRTGHFHPTTLIRADGLEASKGYRSQYEWVEDHDLWLRLAKRGRLANLSQIVLCYRQHADSVCWQRSDLQRTLMNQLLAEAYQSRSLDVPAGVLVEESVVRSAAGPGKWARAAAKGGFLQSTLKHLATMNRSSSPLPYKVRMNLEIAVRLVTGICKRAVGGSIPALPRFPEWHARIEQDGLTSPRGRAA